LISDFLANIATLAAPNSMEPQRKSRRALLIGAIAIIAVAVIVVGVVVLAVNNMGTFSNTNPPSSGSSQTPNQSKTDELAKASSLKFSLSFTQDSSTYGYTISAKNIGTQNMMMRVEGTISQSSGNIIYLLNGAQQKAWMYSDNQWVELSSQFNDQWDTWNNIWNGYFTDLDNWSGIGDYTYTSPSTGETTRIYDVQVNPELPDSLFAP
jgi:hypothetical protein